EVMAPIPTDDEIIGGKQTAQPNRYPRHAPGKKRTDDTTDHGPSHRDERALPQKNRGNVAPPVSHRSQDRDFLHFRKDCHRKNIKDPEPGEEDDERNGYGRREAQGHEKMESRLFAFLPTGSLVLKKYLEVLSQGGGTIWVAQLIYN